MKSADIRALSQGERTAKLTELKKEYFMLREGIRSGTLKETAKAKMLRRDIARLQTLLYSE